MAIESVGCGGTVVTGDDIETFHLLALRGALRLEALGMKRRGASALSVAKKRYGLKGNRAAILAQVEALIEGRR